MFNKVTYVPQFIHTDAEICNWSTNYNTTYQPDHFTNL